MDCTRAGGYRADTIRRKGGSDGHRAETSRCKGGTEIVTTIWKGKGRGSRGGLDRVKGEGLWVPPPGVVSAVVVGFPWSVPKQRAWELSPSPLLGASAPGRDRRQD